MINMFKEQHYFWVIFLSYSCTKPKNEKVCYCYELYSTLAAGGRPPICIFFTKLLKKKTENPRGFLSISICCFFLSLAIWQKLPVLRFAIHQRLIISSYGILEVNGNNECLLFSAQKSLFSPCEMRINILAHSYMSELKYMK